MTDIDRNITEFSAAIGPLFAPHRRDIELLKSRILQRTRRHQNTNELQRRLIRMVAMQLQSEIAA